MIRQALQLDGALPQAWNTLGEILAKMKRIDEAVKALEKSITLRPGDPRVLLLLADLHARKGNRMRALELAGLLSEQRGRLSVQDRAVLADIRRGIEIT